MRAWVVVIAGLCLGGSWGCVSPEPSVSSETARAGLERARHSEARGHFFEARAGFADALEAANGRATLETEALLGLARSERALGEVPASLAHLERALDLARDDPHRVAEINASLGASELAMGNAPAAESWLRASVRQARALDLPGVIALAENDLGILASLQGQAGDASRHFQSSSAAAARADDPGLQARALCNAARAQAQAEPGQAASLREQAARLLESLPESHARAELWVNLGEQARHAVPTSKAEMLRAAEWLTRALNTANAVGDDSVAAQALGSLGALYASLGREEEALKLTDRALARAQKGGQDVSLYRWRAQRGALLRDLGRRDEATEAYARAVAELEPLRHREVWGGALRTSSFQSEMLPVYESLISLLIDQAQASPEAAARQALLRRARDTLEALKAAELRDYFQDDCVDALRSRLTSVEGISRKAAIIYPMALEQGLVVLTSWPSGEISQHRVDIGRSELELETVALRRRLEEAGSRRYLPHARKLYDWLLAPIEERFEQGGVDTLVFVPSGALLTVPMSALHDGNGFLVERYALAITPGLELTDPTPLDQEALFALLAGLSESVDGFAPLPNVVSEIERVHAILGGEVLMNSDFQRESLRASLAENAFGIVHLATHAEFSETGEGGFLLTADGRLSMQSLSSDIGTFRFRDQPLELLTLSACETAQGDQRAALGLSGVAVQAGARSALGSLWSVDDPATALLIGEFYRSLLEPSVSRAEALQRAQRVLLADFRYRHPAYWAAFQLIGSWL